MAGDNAPAIRSLYNKLHLRASQWRALVAGVIIQASRI
jgi:hypothetical protein